MQKQIKYILRKRYKRAYSVPFLKVLSTCNI